VVWVWVWVWCGAVWCSVVWCGVVCVCGGGGDEQSKSVQFGVVVSSGFVEMTTTIIIDTH
jgi:hypothetical protein